MTKDPYKVKMSDNIEQSGFYGFGDGIKIGFEQEIEIFAHIYFRGTVDAYHAFDKMNGADPIIEIIFFEHFLNIALFPLNVINFETNLDRNLFCAFP